jgi:hypothetical protein
MGEPNSTSTYWHDVLIPSLLEHLPLVLHAKGIELHTLSCREARSSSSYSNSNITARDDKT